MSKLQELINNLCPNGVIFEELSKYIDYVQPQKYMVSSTNYSDEHNIPVLTPGQTFILGYTNDDDGIYDVEFNGPIILFDDFTTAKKWVDFNFKVKSSALKILIPKNETINFRYLYHMMEEINFDKGEHGRKWISKYSKIKVPIPPLEIQDEIVKILDNFTNLTAELTAELTAREKQFTYYKNKLLTFSDDDKREKLGNICEFSNGKGHEKNIVDKGEFIVVNSKFISTNGKIKKYTDDQLVPLELEDILLVMSDLPNGKALARTFYVDKNNMYSLNQRIGKIKVINKEEILPKYLFYYLDRNKQLLRYDNGSDQTNLRKQDILNINIFIPEINEQEKIVNILDTYEKITSDMSSGLPAEIEARKKQYEYYRNKLLTFKEL